MALSRHRALLMDDAIRALPLWFRKSCILWYDPKRLGLTNEDIGTDNWKLKNLMDKETCYPYNWEPHKNGIETTATVNKLTIGRCYDFAHLIYPSSEYHGRIKVTNLELSRESGGSGILRIYRAKSSDNSVIGDAIIIEKDGIYDINLDPMEGGNKIYFYIPGDGTILETPIIIELLPTLKGDMKLVNFGKYVFDFKRFYYNGSYADASTVTIESNKITILNNHSSTASLVNISSTHTSITPFRIKITGIESGYRIIMGHDNSIDRGEQTNYWEFTEDGTYTIYTNLGDYPNFGIIYNKIGDCNVIIEELPEPSSCGRGRYLDTPFPLWTLPSQRTANIKDTSVELLSSQFYSYTNNAAITFLYHGLSKTSLSHKYKISGIDPDKYEIWFGNDLGLGYIDENVIIKATKDGIYTVPWADCTLIRNNNTRCIGIHRKEIVSGAVTDTNINITIEQVPEYEDALVFDGIDDYAILDGYMDDIYDHFYCINRRVVLDKSLTGRAVIASSTYALNRHFEVYGPDWYTPALAQYGDLVWYGPSYIKNTNSVLKLLTRNLIQHTLCTPENLQYYSLYYVPAEYGTRYSIKKCTNRDNYKLDEYYIQYKSTGESSGNGIITPGCVFPFESGLTYTLSFDAYVVGNEDVTFDYLNFISAPDRRINGTITISHGAEDDNTAWKRYSITDTFTGTTNAYRSLILIGKYGGTWTLNIKNIKLEIGNKATPYEPAIEDFNLKPSRNIINKFPTAKVSNTTFLDTYDAFITADGNLLVMANVLNSNLEVIGNFPTNLALYSFLLFNRNLTTEEIQWIEENIIPPLPEELSSVYAEGYWKDYTFWRNTDIWRGDIIPDLFVDSGKDYKSVINTDYCPKPVGLYSAKGKTNADTDKNILYDLSGNGNHIKLYNVAFNRMDGYGGFPFNENNITAHDGAIKIGYNKYLLTGGWSYISYLITLGLPITYNIRVSEIQGKNSIAAYCIYSGLVYSEIFNLYEGDNRVTLPADNTGIFVLACPRTDNLASCVVEFLPEYPDGLIFNGTNAYGITGVIDKEFKDYTVIIKRKLLNNTGYTCALDDASEDGSGNSTFFVEGTDCYSYGYDNDVPLLTRFKDSLYIWQTSDSFCGIPIIRGNIVPNNLKLSIGTAYPNDLSFCLNIVFYSLALFDKKLTSLLIEWFIRNKM